MVNFILKAILVIAVMLVVVALTSYLGGDAVVVYTTASGMVFTLSKTLAFLSGALVLFYKSIK